MRWCALFVGNLSVTTISTLIVQIMDLSKTQSRLTEDRFTLQRISHPRTSLAREDIGSANHLQEDSNYQELVIASEISSHSC